MTMRLIFRAFVEWATFLKEFALLGKVWVEACAGVLKELREIWYIIMPLASAGGLGGEHKNIVLLRLVRALKVFMSMGALVLGTLLQVPEAWFGDWGNRSSYLAYSCSMPSRICFPDLLERKRGIEKNALSFSPLDRRRSWKIQLRMLALPAPVWMRYGTAYRALYTLYEITFAGNWPTNVRPVLDRAGHGFVIFFVVYITIIVFAVIRVISAIFLKDTLDAANNDAEHLVVERLRKKAEYVEKLEQVFHAMDDSGDGMITEERLTNILANPVAKAYFQTLDVDIYESAALFHLLDNGDGEVTLEEFIEGIMRCKGQARAIDQALGWCAGVLLCRMLKSSGLISTPSLSHKEEGREWVCKQVFSTFVKSTLIPEVDDDDDTASRFSSLGEGLHWDVADYADKPLELLGSLLQEDICIMHEDLVGGEPTHVFAAGVVMDSFDPVSKHLQAFEGVPGNNRSWFAAQVRICTNIAAKAS
ncbi:unnamed protein product [Symbiodinium sp. KB8]|nr:unnamed protein product [Symbiodinium sp. KB8]